MKDLYLRGAKFGGYVDPSTITDQSDVEELPTPDNTYDSWDIADYDNTVAGITVCDLDILIGDIFITTELLGLPERQLAAYKKVVRQRFWDWYNGQLPNPTGLFDVSYQARVHNGIEKE